MRSIQESRPVRVVVWVLLSLTFFIGVLFAQKGLMAFPYMEIQRIEDTVDFQRLFERRLEQMTRYAECRSALETEDLTYVQRQQYQETIEQIQRSMEPENTNFRFEVLNQDGSQIYSHNLSKDEPALGQVVTQIQYTTLDLEHGRVILESQPAMQLDQGMVDTVATIPAPMTFEGEIILRCGVLTPDRFTSPDEFYDLHQTIRQSQTQLRFDMAVSLLMGIVSLMLSAFVLWSSGHQRGREGVVLSWQERIYSEIYLMLLAAASVAEWMHWREWGDELFGGVEMHPVERELVPILSAIATTVWAVLVVLVLRTLVVRGKAGMLGKTSLICQLLRWMRGRLTLLLQNLPMTGRILLLFPGYLLIIYIVDTVAPLCYFYPAPGILVNLAVLLLLCWWGASFYRIHKGIEIIAAGNLNHQIDTTNLPADLKKQAEALNNLSEGLTTAVNEQMKSERFKAELITNVSHDLKTPLTSIINYVDLLKTTRQTDPTAQKYIEVLDRKSQRLKKLTEDLVEASKASTGMLSVNREKIGMVQLLDQALGEYDERLESHSLKVVRTVPEDECYVYADGRHLWRVIDNLLSNCAKYALEETRIYLELTRGRGSVTLSIKNISREALNIPPERLMERFVRGEESRSTEGSGLGLSIARSLTELQGGSFELMVDGDLFKAVVTLPQSA